MAGLHHVSTSPEQPQRAFSTIVQTRGKVAEFVGVLEKGNVTSLMSASRRWPFWHHRCHGSVKRKRKRATPCSCAFIDPGRAHTSTRSLHVCPGHWAPASMLTLKIPCRQLHRIPVSKPTGLENTSHLLPLRVPQSQTVGPPEEEDGLASPTREGPQRCPAT